MERLIAVLIYLAVPFVAHGRYAAYQYNTGNSFSIDTNSFLNADTPDINLLGNDILRATLLNDADDLMKAAIDYYGCSNDNIVNKFSPNNTGVEDQNMYMDICRSFETAQYRSCENNVRKNHQSTLGENINTLDALVNMLHIAVDFACENHLKNVKDFMDADGPSCLAIVSDNLFSCTSTNLGIDADWTPTVASVAKLLKKEHGCRPYSDTRKCIVKNLNNCSNDIPSKIINSMYERLEKVVGCSG